MKGFRMTLAVMACMLVAGTGRAMTHEELQWQGYSERIVEFSGYSWRAKNGGPWGPGNNYFSDSPENAWVDTNGWLHLRVTRRDGRWYCPELVLTEPLGYGDYIFKTIGRVDQLDRNMILGLFTWEYQESYGSNDVYNGANEFDIEFGRWKDPARQPVQFACQPWQHAGNEHRYDLALTRDDEPSSHAFLWHPSGMACRSWRGHSDEPDPSEMIHSWFYSGRHIPRNEAPRVHVNFWCIEEPPADLQEHEVVIAGFKFVPFAALPGSRLAGRWWMFWRR